MLLAVEGGRFFSSSASGYTNGLNLLLLGHNKKEEKPMKVTPWNNYRLVDQEPNNPNFQLAANNNNNRCTCCFGGATENPSVGPTHKPKDGPKIISSGLEKNEENDGNGSNVNSVKSSVKRRGLVTVGNGDEVETVCESSRRSVHWTDVRGGELCEIREFEPSEHSDSDDEFENSTTKTCSCTIM